MYIDNNHKTEMTYVWQSFVQILNPTVEKALKPALGSLNAHTLTQQLTSMDD